jgi:hypothetical protein
VTFEVVEVRVSPELQRALDKARVAVEAERAGLTPVERKIAGEMDRHIDAQMRNAILYGSNAES